MTNFRAGLVRGASRRGALSPGDKKSTLELRSMGGLHEAWIVAGRLFGHLRCRRRAGAFGGFGAGQALRGGDRQCHHPDRRHPGAATAPRA